MEPPLNHLDAFNPGLAGPDFTGRSFSVGHETLRPAGAVPIPPYASPGDAYYAACDPLTALRDAAVEAMVRHAVKEADSAWPEQPVENADRHDANIAAHYSLEDLQALRRIRDLASQSRMFPLAPLFTNARPVVGINTFRDDPDRRLITECQSLAAGRYDPPTEAMLDREPPWSENWYDRCKDLFEDYEPTRCWYNDVGDCYIVYELQCEPSVDCPVVVARPGVGVNDVPSEDPMPTIEQLGTAASLAHVGSIIAATERVALAKDLLHVAVHRQPVPQTLTDMMQPPRDRLVRSALLDHLDHRPLDYHGTPPEWGGWGISPANAIGPFVAREPLQPSLEHEGPSLGL